MVVMAVKLLVKIAVMMMAPGGTPAPPEARGREPPSFFFFFFFLGLPSRWEESPHVVHGLHGGEGAGAPLRLDLPLCSLLFRVPQISPFTVSSIPGDP